MSSISSRSWGENCLWKMKANLFTSDKYLGQIMLEEYPGPIFDDQYEVTKIENGKEYSFFDLDCWRLLKFISKYENKYEFEIYDCDGELVKESKRYDYLEDLVSDN